MAQAPTLRLRVATPRGQQIDLDVAHVQLPGVVGELGFHPGHRELVTTLAPGIMRYSVEGTLCAAVLREGFAEIRGDAVEVVSRYFTPSEALKGKSMELATLFEAAQTSLKACDGSLDEPESMRLQSEVRWLEAKRRLALS